MWRPVPNLILVVLALFAGQFGPLGLLLYFAAVLITIR